MAPVVIYTQSAFRARNDDGSETEATWYANENQNFTAPKNTNIRLRFQIDTSGDAPSNQYQLEYRKVGEETWKKVGT